MNSERQYINSCKHFICQLIIITSHEWFTYAFVTWPFFIIAFEHQINNKYLSTNF